MFCVCCLVKLHLCSSFLWLSSFLVFCIAFSLKNLSFPLGSLPFSFPHFSSYLSSLFVSDFSLLLSFPLLSSTNFCSIYRNSLYVYLWASQLMCPWCQFDSPAALNDLLDMELDSLNVAPTQVSTTATQVEDVWHERKFTSPDAWKNCLFATECHFVFRILPSYSFSIEEASC